jgi:hypothetical protein
MGATRYQIAEVAKQLKTTKRTIQRKLKKLDIPQDSEGYIITDEVVRQLRPKSPTELTTTSHESVYGLGLHRQDDGTLMQVFSQDEYDKFKQMLIEHKELKSRVAQLQDWVERFTTYTQERNTIEAHDKGLLKHVNEKTEDVEPIERMVIEKRTQKLSDKELRSLTPSEKMDFYKWISCLRTNYQES